MQRPKTVDEYIEELRNNITFLQGLVSKRDEELKKLKQQLEPLKAVIRNQPIPIQYKSFNPKKYENLWQLIDLEAILLTKETGTPFYWQTLYDRLEHKHRNIKWNPETVRRRCQLSVKEGLLQRVDEGTYIYVGGLKNE